MSQLSKEVQAFLAELAEQAPAYGEVVAMTTAMAIGSKARRLLQVACVNSIDEVEPAQRMALWLADAQWHDDTEVVKAEVYDAHIDALKAELQDVCQAQTVVINSRNSYQWECERLTESLTSMQARVVIEWAHDQQVYDEEKERPLFEAAYASEYNEARWETVTEQDIASMREGDNYGNRPYLNGQWKGWKACAKSRASRFGGSE